MTSTLIHVGMTLPRHAPIPAVSATSDALRSSLIARELRRRRPSLDPAG